MRIELECKVDCFDADDAVSINEDTGEWVLDPKLMSVNEWMLRFRSPPMMPRLFMYACDSGISSVFDTTDKRPFTIVITDEKPRTITDDVIVFKRKAHEPKVQGVWTPSIIINTTCISHTIRQFNASGYLCDLLRDVRGSTQDGNLCLASGGETWYVWAE